MTAIGRRIGLAALGLLGAFIAGCPDAPEEHDHSEAHPQGHDHHEEGHGHDQPMQTLTLWSERFEVFAEHPLPVAGEELAMLVHVTVLEDFRPLALAEPSLLALELDGPDAIRVHVEASAQVRPGVYWLKFVPASAGRYRGQFVLSGEHPERVQGAVLTVAPRAVQAPRQEHEDEHEHAHAEQIEFLKEQQWAVPFATAFAREGKLTESVEVPGRVGTPPGQTAEVSAPVTGRIVLPPDGLPPPGTVVKRGQLLASIVPAPSSPEGVAQAELRRSEARARAEAAAQALERAERLFADEAISRRELEDARREREVALEAVEAARRAAALYAGPGPAADASALRLTAPITGTLAELRATPGATASAGELLFRVVDPSELWITARVPEQDAARLRADRDASYRVAGMETWMPIDLSGEDRNASLVSVARTVDPISRTVDVIYALDAANPALRVGGLARVRLPTGEDFQGVTVPASALVDQEGRDVVYVQVDGEHFVERPVRVAVRAGELAGLSSGLRAGERVVVRGANLIRLADRARGGEAHGHVH